MSDNNFELKEYTLGSGHIHIADAVDIPKTEAEFKTFLNTFFESQDNILGRVKGGASVEYTTEKTEDQDDLGFVVIEEITKEKVTLKSGVMTWNGETLKRICSTARVTYDKDTNVAIVKIGGLDNQDGKRYIIGFEHKSKKLRVVIIGKNNEGFTFSFAQDKATVIDVLFRAEALDDEGTLIYLQDFRKATAAVAANSSGTTSSSGTNGDKAAE